MNSPNNNPRLAEEQFNYLLMEGEVDNDPPPKIPYYGGIIHYKGRIPERDRQVIEYVATSALVGTGQVGFDPVQRSMVMFLQVWDTDRRRCKDLEDIEAVWLVVESDGSM